MFRLDKKIVFVTGGTTGLGFAIAKLFSEVGASIALMSRRLDVAEESIKNLTDMEQRAIHICGDVTKVSDIKRAVDSILDRFGRIDVLVNSAGVMRRGDILNTSEEDWDYLLDINLKGAYLCSKSVLPTMLENSYGVILNIGSVHGLKGGAGTTTAYTVSKAGLISLTKSMAVRYGPQGIRVNCLCPGFVPTDLNRDLIENAPDPEQRKKEYEVGYPLRRLGNPEDVACAALYLVSDEASWVTGSVLTVDGGLTAK